MSDAVDELAPGVIERTGPNAGRRHVLPFGVHVVGRGDAVSVELDDRDVSRRHAEIEVGPDRMTVTDLGSKNGVVFNGRPVHSSLKLGHGDEFEIGAIKLEVDHPAARFGRILAEGGEITRTRTSPRRDAEQRTSSLLLPILGVVVFGALVVALLVFG